MLSLEVAGVHFPLYSAAPGPTELEAGTWDGRRMGRRAANNVLWLADPVAALPAWRHVGARPRWNLLPADGDDWCRNDDSMMKIGQRRWWGRRHHVRIWRQDGYAIGQAHFETWEGSLRRHHRVLSLDAGRDAIVEAAEAAGCVVSYAMVGSDGVDWDGRIAVIRPGRNTGPGAGDNPD